MEAGQVLLVRRSPGGSTPSRNTPRARQARKYCLDSAGWREYPLSSAGACVLLVHRLSDSVVGGTFVRHVCCDLPSSHGMSVSSARRRKSGPTLRRKRVGKIKKVQELGLEWLLGRVEQGQGTSVHPRCAISFCRSASRSGPAPAPPRLATFARRVPVSVHAWRTA